MNSTRISQHQHLNARASERSTKNRTPKRPIHHAKSTEFAANQTAKRPEDRAGRHTHLLGRVPLRRDGAGCPERGGERRQRVFQARTPPRIRVHRRLVARRCSGRRRWVEQRQQQEEGEEAAGHGDRGERRGQE